jgi:hypothetical protein
MMFQKRVLGCALIVLASVTSTGCIAFMSIARGILQGDADVARCLEAESVFRCAFGYGEEGSTSSIEDPDGFGEALLDPIVLEVPAGTSSQIAGSFTNNLGQSGNLIVYPALPFIPVDDTRTMKAGPGKELVILDLPDTAARDAFYEFELDLPQLVTPGSTANVKAVATGKRTIGGKAFYMPLMPCTSVIASMPTIELPYTSTATRIDIRLRDITGCNHEIYRYTRPPQICDLDNDADVDQRDLDIVTRTGAAAPGDPRDIDRSGTFTAADVNQCQTQCTRGSCATEPTTPLTYLLAEGATGAFFDTELLLANPTLNFAPVTLRYLRPGGAPIEQERTLAPMSRTTLRLDDVSGLEDAEFSTVVTSTAGVPLVVERTMRWDAALDYGAHSEKATAGAAPTWYFAEGSQGFFFTYFLLVNPQPDANTARVTYLREGAAPIVREYALSPFSRRTVFAGDEAALIDSSFGARIDFEQPGMAERAMYFGTTPLFNGGHESAGVTAPSTSWFLAEGATGSFFTTFVLLANPGDVDANVTLTYLPSTGVPVIKRVTLPARQRMTRNIATEDAALESAAVGVRIESDRGIIVERAQYWPNPAETWAEAHNSFGVTETATRWGLAEGRVGGPGSAQTYILLANPGTQRAEVAVTFFRPTGSIVPKHFTVEPGSRLNVAVAGPGSHVPELVDESFGALIESTQPIVVERSLYSNVGNAVWGSGTNATATRLP